MNWEHWVVVAAIVALSLMACRPRQHWVQGLVECRVCGHRRVAVAPYPEPGLHDLECPDCGVFACDACDPFDPVTPSS